MTTLTLELLHRIYGRMSDDLDPWVQDRGVYKPEDEVDNEDCRPRVEEWYSKLSFLLHNTESAKELTSAVRAWRYLKGHDAPDNKEIQNLKDIVSQYMLTESSSWGRAYAVAALKGGSNAV
jgi:hypothetical protein